MSFAATVQHMRPRRQDFSVMNVQDSRQEGKIEILMERKNYLHEN
jgi:hypothetical protein